ncbi:hypothetical protein BV25DRAFT_1305561 [Artomyces pyxidatus]|uniref:Uncharacterized protein n=1 Tax=Artomyces pyxidatus TaxID=48021 RepID=A0ACB8SQG7_9AGAM|nr:hypothetical protein BV25DRAFT_1305561 [Artomyces pyxidatus]
MSHLLLLPTEVVLMVLEDLNLGDLLNLRLTCRELNNVIKDSVILQYKIELAASGMVDCPGGQLSTVSRLEMLQRHQRAWRDFSVLEPVLIPPPRGLGENERAMVIFSEGILAYLYVESGGPNSTICFTQLPSKLRRVDYRRWYLHYDRRLRLLFEDLSIDASQDLLLFVTASEDRNIPVVHVHSLSTGHPHQEGPVSGTIGIEHGSLVFPKIEICGDYIGMVISSDRRLMKVSIWNWKTGVIQTESAVNPSQYTTFCFLDDSHILVQSLPVPLIAPAPLLQVYNFRTAHGLYFVLPFTSRHIEAHLLPNAVHHPPTSIGVHDLFVTDPNDKLVVSIVDHQRRPAERYELCIAAQKLLDIFRTERRANTGFPWSEWGPDAAHCAPLRGDMADGAYAVFGMKTAHLISRDGRNMAIITDYHPRRVKRTQDESADWTPSGVQRRETGGVSEPRLPYTVKEVLLPEAYGMDIFLAQHHFYEDGLLLQYHERSGDEWRAKEIWLTL